MPSAYTLASEADAADYLRLSTRKLRDMRQRGRGPKWFRLPNGDVRYTIEGLDAWAHSSSTTVRAVHTENLLAFPGVKIRPMLPDDWTSRRHDSDEAEFDDAG